MPTLILLLPAWREPGVRTFRRGRRASAPKQHS